MNTDHSNRPGGNRQNEDDQLNDGLQHDHPASRHIHFDIDYDYGERFRNENDWKNPASNTILTDDPAPDKKFKNQDARENENNIARNAT